MANFKKAKVDFPESSRVRSVTVDDSTQLEAIFFNGAEKAIMKGKPTTRMTVPMAGVKVDPESVLQDGSGDETPVCYLINGELVCW
jgi:hypothetical protein